MALAGHLLRCNYHGIETLGGRNAGDMRVTFFMPKVQAVEPLLEFVPIRSPRREVVGVGTLVGDPASLYAALLAKSVTLESHSGRPSFGITVTDASMSSRQAAFMTAGTVFDP